MVRNTYEVQKLGDLLREKRKSLGKDIKEIAEQTKIRAEYLLALESGNYDKFTASVYAKGFLKKYAQYLGISPDRAVAMYRRERLGQTGEGLRQNPLFNNSIVKPNLQISWGKLLTFVILLLLAGFGIYLFSRVSTVAQPPRLALSIPVLAGVGETAVYQTTAETFTLTGSVELGASLAVNDANVDLNNLDQFEVRDIRLAEGLNTFLLKARSQFGQESTITLNVNRVSATTASTPAPNSLSLEVSTSVANTYVQIEADGARVLADTLAVNEPSNFTAASAFVISTARFNSVDVTVNGTEVNLTSSRPHRIKLSETGQVQVTPE